MNNNVSLRVTAVQVVQGEEVQVIDVVGCAEVACVFMWTQCQIHQLKVCLLLCDVGF